MRRPMPRFDNIRENNFLSCIFNLNVSLSLVYLGPCIKLRRAITASAAAAVIAVVVAATPVCNFATPAIGLGFE